MLVFGRLIVISSLLSTFEAFTPPALSFILIIRLSLFSSNITLSH
ncbi:hypothetical protein [Aliarcobacter butzleri]|nr:hypothetical protein [Aliarcobacter butzleri]